MAFESLEHPIAATSVRFKPGQRTKYVPNHRSFGAFMKSDQMRDVNKLLDWLPEELAAL